MLLLVIVIWVSWFWHVWVVSFSKCSTYLHTFCFVLSCRFGLLILVFIAEVWLSLWELFCSRVFSFFSSCFKCSLYGKKTYYSLQFCSAIQSYNSFQPKYFISLLLHQLFCSKTQVGKCTVDMLSLILTMHIYIIQVSWVLVHILLKWYFARKTMWTFTTLSHAPPGRTRIATSSLWPVTMSGVDCKMLLTISKTAPPTCKCCLGILKSKRMKVQQVDTRLIKC